MDKERLVKKKLRAKRDGNTRQFADATNDLADLYFEAGDFGAALEEHSEVVKACEILDDRLNCAVTHRKIGEIHMGLGEYKKALEHQSLYLEGTKGVKNKVEEQRALLALGRTYFCLAESWAENSKGRTEALADARKAYSKSIILCNNFTRKDIPKEELMTMRARLLLNQGQVLVAQNEPEAGIDLIKQAIKICSVNNLTEDLHRAHLTLGVFHEKRGNIRLALEHYDLAAEAENASTKGNALLAKAELFLRSGEWTEARRVLTALYPDKDLPQSTRAQLEKWLRISVTLCRGQRRLNSGYSEPDGFSLYENLGDAAAAAGCYHRALGYYEGMLSHAEKNKSSKEIAAALVSLAQTSKDAGRYKEALAFGRRELKMCSDPCEACKTALFLANVSESTGVPSSEICRAYKLALAKAEATKNPWLEMTVLKEFLEYLESRKSKGSEKIKRRLNLLLETTPEIKSQEINENPDIGAGINLDDLSDVEQPEDAARELPRRSKVLKRNVKGETQLHVACIRGNIRRVKELLENGDPTNVRDNCGWTPLHEAANHGFVEIAKLLITAGANIDDPGGAECGEITPLHDAASNGHLAMVEFLIDNGANVFAVTGKGETTIDLLEEWRTRAENLTQAYKRKYLNVRDKLSARGVRGREEINRIGREGTGRRKNRKDSMNEKIILANVPTGDDYKRLMRFLSNRAAPSNSLN